MIVATKYRYIMYTHIRRVFEQEDTGLGEVVAVEKLTKRSAGAPAGEADAALRGRRTEVGEQMNATFT